MDVKRAKPKPPRTVLSALRVRLFLAGFLVSGVSAVATGQPAVAPPRRAATLLPPQMVGPGETPAVARGAIDDSPVVTGSTPATRPGPRPPAPGGPAWLNGIDPNVVPAGMASVPPTSVSRPFVSPLPPRPAAPSGVPAGDPAPVVPKANDRWKGFVGAEQPGRDPRLSADPNAPLRGVAANGAPVLAGPPAYRWFGWGGTTPGGNTFAPSGQYPRASENWLSTTGATPGAFPVPVMNPYRPAPGSDPPAYTMAPAARPTVTPAQPYDVATGGPAGPGPVYNSARGPGQPVVSSPAASASKFNPTPPAPVMTPVRPDPAPAGVPPVRPALPPGPATGPVGRPTAPEARVLPPSPPPTGLPTIAVPPTMTAAGVPPLPLIPVTTPAPVAAAVVPPPSPVSPEPEVKRLVPVAPPAVDPAPVVPLVAPPTPVEVKPPAPVVVKPATPSGPSPLPVSVTEEIQWRTNSDKTVPAPPGTWVPAAGTPRTPETAPDGEFREPGATNTARPLARAQGPDTDRPADPVTALIQAMCRGRADGVDVRWTGSRKIAVCFEVGSSREADALVKDISARRELAPYQIDFAVFVK